MGMSFGVLCMPRRWSTRAKAGLLVVFAMLGNAPDVANKLTPYGWYNIVHSVFLNVGAILLLAAMLCVWWWQKGKPRGVWPIFWCGGGAWLSHLLLDTFYNHGKGIQIFWPASDAALALPIPWFKTWQQPLDVYLIPNILTSLRELWVYGVLLLLCVLARHLWFRRSKTEMDQ